MKTIFTINKFMLCFSAFFFSHLVRAQAPSYAWVNQGYYFSGGNTLQVKGTAITLDATCNSYVTGTFTGRSVFGKGADTIPVNELVGIHNNDMGDQYLAKYDNSGKVLWVKTAGIKQRTVGLLNGAAVATDATNSYVAGNFYDTLLIGSTTLTVAANQTGGYIASYDGSGMLLWAKKCGAGNISVTDMSLDASSNLYVTGYAAGSATIAGTPIAPGYSFIAKYSNSGNPLWAKATPAFSAISCSGANLFLVGNFNTATVAFGSTTVTNPVTGNNDVYVVKTDTAGNYIWAKGSTSTFTAALSQGTDIVADNAGNSYVTGGFRGGLAFGTTTLSTAPGNQSQQDGFLIKFDATGTALWGKSFVATNNSSNNMNGICTDQSGSIYITGDFAYQTNFGAVTIPASALNPAGGFVSKYDANGINLWATYICSHYGKAIAANASGPYVIGTFSHSEVFGSFTLSNSSFWPSMFVGKLGAATGISSFNINEHDMTVYPNPATHQFYIDVKEELKSARLEITDVIGRTVYAETINTQNRVSIDCSTWAKGLYVVKLSNEQDQSLRKIIIE